MVSNLAPTIISGAGGIIYKPKPNVGTTIKNLDDVVVKSRENALISTSKGVIILPETLSKQGTSKLVGDFTKLESATVEEIISRVPITRRNCGYFISRL